MIGPLIQSILVAHFVKFTFVFARISGLMMTAPIFGSQALPLRIRALLAMAVALLITPVHLAGTAAHPGTMLNYLVGLGTELLIGLVLGLGVLILFSGVQVAGQIIGQLSGMALADVFNPAFDANSPIFSQMLFYVALAVFVLLDGHRMVLGAVLDTFVAIPPGSGSVGNATVTTLTATLSQSFTVGIRAAAPVMTALLLSTFILGLISRTLPQLNIIAVGFGLNSMITLSALFLSLGGIALIFQEQVSPLLSELGQALLADNPAASGG